MKKTNRFTHDGINNNYKYLYNNINSLENINNINNVRQNNHKVYKKVLKLDVIHLLEWESEGIEYFFKKE